jgi:hypothetical protein
MCAENEEPAELDVAERTLVPPPADDLWLCEWRGRPLEPEDAYRLLASLAKQPSTN